MAARRCGLTLMWRDTSPQHFNTTGGEWPGGEAPYNCTPHRAPRRAGSAWARMLRSADSDFALLSLGLTKHVTNDSDACSPEACARPPCAPRHAVQCRQGRACRAGARWGTAGRRRAPAPGRRLAEQAGDPHLPGAGAPPPRPASRSGRACTPLTCLQAQAPPRLQPGRQASRLLPTRYILTDDDTGRRDENVEYSAQEVTTRRPSMCNLMWRERPGCGGRAGAGSAGHLEPDDRAVAVPPRQRPRLRVLALLLPLRAPGAHASLLSL